MTDEEIMRLQIEKREKTGATKLRKAANVEIERRKFNLPHFRRTVPLGIGVKCTGCTQIDGEYWHVCEKCDTEYPVTLGFWRSEIDEEHNSICRKCRDGNKAPRRRRNKRRHQLEKSGQRNLSFSSTNEKTVTRSELKRRLEENKEKQEALDKEKDEILAAMEMVEKFG